MAERPIEASGTLYEEQGAWYIKLEAPPPVGTEGSVHLKLVYWKDEGASSEYEKIARAQQLPLDVVAHGLAAEGALHDVRQRFLDRLYPVKDREES